MISSQRARLNGAYVRFSDFEACMALTQMRWPMKDSGKPVGGDLAWETNLLDYTWPDICAFFTRTMSEKRGSVSRVIRNAIDGFMFLWDSNAPTKSQSSSSGKYWSVECLCVSLRCLAKCVVVRFVLVWLRYFSGRVGRCCSFSFVVQTRICH